MALVLLAAACVTAPGTAFGDARCASIAQRQGIGPFDYRERGDRVARSLRLVEQHHLTPGQRQGAMRGDTNTKLGVWKNLDYTLRAFPNHPRALFLMSVFAHQVKTFKPDQWRLIAQARDFAPVQCYFQRAAGMFPDDPGVYNALGIALSREKQWDEAIKAFRKVVKLAGESPDAHYNLALALFGAGRFEESRDSARKAYSLGYRKTDLKRRLQRKGYWE